MTIAFTVPTWMLWVGGVVAGIALLGLAALGVTFLVVMREFNRGVGRWFGW